MALLNTNKMRTDQEAERETDERETDERESEWERDRDRESGRETYERVSVRETYGSE